jgi:hypothetical protein
MKELKGGGKCEYLASITVSLPYLLSLDMQ